MKKLFLCLLSITTIQLSYAQTAGDAIHHLQNKRFDKALQTLDGALDKLSTEEFTADQLLLLRARAFDYDKQPQKVIEAVDQLIAKYPNSKWISKAKFLKAHALVDLKKHAEAAVIYQTMAQTLFSPASKNAGAELLMEIAEGFSKERNAEETTEDQPKPDLAKAEALLKEAYETDCSDELKEQLLSKRIQINTRSSQWKKVIALSFLYLNDFDPEWQGKLGSLERLTSLTAKAEENTYTGKNRYMVRLHLAEALHRNNERITASRYLTELIVDLQQVNNDAQKGLLADAAWLRLMTSRTQGGQPRNTREWMSDVQDYLKNYPDHIHASATVYSIGVIYQNAEQHDQAIAAFQGFLDDQYKIKITPNPLTSRPENKLDFSKRQKKADSSREYASYRIGQIHLKNKQFDKAKEAWIATSKAYPNGARWADCQRGLVDIHYQRSLHAVTVIKTAESPDTKTKARQDAQQALEKFTTSHPLDKRVPSLLYLIGNIHYIHANEIEEAGSSLPVFPKKLKKEQATALKLTLESWEKLITKYPSSSYSSDAQYLTATIYENTTGDLDKAITAYKKSSHQNANNRITTLTSKKLIAFSNKNFTTTEKPFIQLSTRNIEEVTVRQYWLDIESYFRKGRKLENISSLDVDLVEADKTWKHTLPDYKKRHLLESKIDIPFPKNKPGICIIKIESKDYSTTTMVMRSDIDLAVRSSASEMIAYAFNARTNKPSSGVNLLITDAGKVVAKGKTNKQGYFHLKDEKLNEISDLRVLALSPKGIATCSFQDDPPELPNQILPSINNPTRSSRIIFSPDNKTKAFFNHPKSIYPAGEILPISGIIRHNKDGVYIFPNKDQRSYTLSIRCKQKLLYTSPITLNDRGVFTHEYTLPEYLPNWAVTISLSPDFDKDAPELTHRVSIGKNSEGILNLDLDIKKTWINKGESITGKISATYRWGAPYANQKLVIRLPENQRLEVITDDKGKAEFTFTPLFFNAGTMLDFRAVTADNKHTSDTETVLYDPIPFSILAVSEHRIMSTGSTSNIEIKTISPDGKPISKLLNLEIIEIETVDPDPILASTRSMENVTRRFNKEKVLETIPLTTDPKTGKITHPLKLEKAGTYELRVSAQGVSKFERSAIARSSINVYDPGNSDSIVIQKPSKNDAKAGQTTNLNTWSSLKKTVPALLTIETHTIIEKRIIQLKPGQNFIPIELGAKHCPSIKVHILALSDRKVFSAHQILSVLNPITIKSTLVDITGQPSNENTIKLKLQAFDSNGKATVADTFVNLSQSEQSTSKYLTQTFNNSQSAFFLNTSSTGLLHEGYQEAINTTVRDELEKLTQAENDSIQRYSNNPILSQESSGLIGQVRKHLYRANLYYNQTEFDKAKREYQNILRLDPYNKAAKRGLVKINAANNDFHRASYDQTRANLLTEVDQTWEMNSNTNFVDQSFIQSGQIQTTQQNNANSYLNNHKIYSDFNAKNSFSTNANFINKTTDSTPSLRHGQVWTSTEHIPAEGKEITINAKHIESPEYHLQVLGFSNTNANGILTEKIPVPERKIAKKKSTQRLKGIPVTKKTNTILNVGENLVTLALPDGAATNDLKLAIASSSNFLTQAVTNDLVSELGAATPFHAEHPAGKLMAYIAQLDYLTHQKLDEPLRNELKIKINRLCSNLTLSQKDNGSWAAVRNRNMNSLLHSAIAYQALVMATKQGIDIEPSTIVKAKKWLNDQQKEIGTDFYNSRALVQYALATSDDADFATCNRLFRERQKMDNIGKAILANTFVLLDRKEFTATLLKEIKVNPTVTKHEELSLNSPTLLRALIFEARNAVEKQTEINPSFTLLYHSDIERGVSVRAYTKFLKGQKVDDKKETITITINGNKIENEILPEHLKQGENTIKINSTKPVYLSAILSGYEPAKELKALENFVIQDRKYYRDNLLYKGSLLKSSGTSETNTLHLGETVKVVLKGKISDKNHAHSILVEELPAGFTYLSGSLRGNHSGARIEGNHLVITYSSVPENYSLSYTLIASEVGTWYHRPSLLSPTYNVSKLVYNAAKQLTVLSPDKTKETPYQTNAAEHYELAKLYFDDKEYTEAKKQIIQYNKLKQSSEDPQLAKMLLWIEADSETPDAQLLADSFEVLTERAPELIIPFEKILKVGNAYRSIGEHERSADVYTATLEANFIAESYISAVLEDQGKFSLSLDYQDKLWLQYPDLGEITTSRFELAQQLYTIATDVKKSAKLGNNPKTKKPYSEKELTTLSLDYMQSFLTRSPTHHFAADASFSIANALFALKRYQQVIDHTVDAAVTHKDSTHATSFRYMQAVGHYWLRNYDQALAAASKVAQESSDDKDLAAFITAQIYHAKGQPEKAIKWYEGIKDKYPDAKQSIAYFEQKSISLDEVKILNSGDKATLKLKFRNIKEAQFQIYRVDLLKLYLREKNLSDISKINLAGINPKHSLTVQLGDGKDFKEKEKTVELPISKDGAYLVICRGDYLYTSGLTLITPLKMEVQEDQDARSVRVNISDKKSGKYLDAVHIKAVGVNKSKIVSGDTDLRGVWQGDEVQSPSTIIAKDKKGRYAFFRSKIIKSTIVEPKMTTEAERKPSKGKVDFNSNLKMKQDSLNQDNSYNYELKRRSKGKGVEIQKARKK